MIMIIIIVTIISIPLITISSNFHDRHHKSHTKVCKKHYNFSPHDLAKLAWFNAKFKTIVPIAEHLPGCHSLI